MIETIQEWRKKIKEFPRALRSDIFLVAVIVLVSVASFGLGRLSVFYGEHDPIKVVYPSSQSGAVAGAFDSTLEGEGGALQSSDLQSAALGDGQYVASKSGSKYHLPWCPGAQSIKEENKIWFSSKEDAERAGYTPAGNCKGI